MQREGPFNMPRHIAQHRSVKLNGTKRNDSAFVQLVDAMARFVAAERGGEQGVRAMRVSIFGKAGRDHAHDPSRRGYHIAYRENQVNNCPGCGRSHWYIGRLSAECGFCGTALPLTESLSSGAGMFRCSGRSHALPDFQAAA
jgi:hypothetical protein